MIAFKKLSLMERIRRLSPVYRRQQDAKLREAIKYLVSHPESPCMIEGNIIENGYGMPDIFNAAPQVPGAVRPWETDDL